MMAPSGPVTQDRGRCQKRQISSPCEEGQLALGHDDYDGHDDHDDNNDNADNKVHLVKRDNLHLAMRQRAAMMKTARPATPRAQPASTSDRRCRLKNFKESVFMWKIHLPLNEIWFQEQ